MNTLPKKSSKKGKKKSLIKNSPRPEISAHSGNNSQNGSGDAVLNSKSNLQFRFLTVFFIEVIKKRGKGDRSVSAVRR